MDYKIAIIVGIIIFILFDILILIKIFYRKEAFSQKFKSLIKKHISKINLLPLDKQIFEYDKILDKCLKEMNVK